MGWGRQEVPGETACPLGTTTVTAGRSVMLVCTGTACAAVLDTFAGLATVDGYAPSGGTADAITLTTGRGYGNIGKAAALQDGFAYSDSMRVAAASGLVWTVENILDYAANPKEFLRARTGDPKTEGAMVYRLVKGQDALISYLRAVGPRP